MFHNYKAYFRVFIDKLYSGCSNVINWWSEPEIPPTRRVYGSNSSLMHLSNLVQHPNQIDDNLFLGNGYDAADWEVLEELGISGVVNATRELRCYFEDEDIDYLKIDVLDNGVATIRPHFDEFLQFLEQHKGEKILVHCYMGSSRSATLVLLYLVKSKGMTVDEALNYLKARRDFVNVNERFLQELREYCA